MSFKNIMSRIRYWDNQIARWVMRHIYFMFFQIILVVIFIFWFSNTINVIDLNFQVQQENILERILLTQSINTTVIVILFLLNSFWMLYMFNGIQRIRSLLKDVCFHLSKLRNPPRS